MNMKSFRREMLICVGGFLAGGLTMAAAFALWPQPPLGIQFTHATSGVNYLVVPKPAEVSFKTEFGLRAADSATADMIAPRKRAYGRLNLFDMPRQQPWVAPYEFLIQPAQRH